MRKPVIACDFDDVFNNFGVAFNTHSRLVHGAPETYEELAAFDFSVDYNLDRDEADRRVLHFIGQLHHEVQPVPEAIASLRILAQDYSLHMVTSRCESAAGVSHDWLDKHASGIFADTHFCNGMATLFPDRRRRKLEVCLQIGATRFIDDSLGHVREVSAGMGIPVYMPTRPWNRNETPLGVTRVREIDEVLQHIYG